MAKLTEIEQIELEEQLLQAGLKSRLRAGDIETEIILTPKQTEFVESGEKGYNEVLFSGGAGSGKSMALLVKLLEYVAVPNTTVALIRQNYTDLQRSTVRLLKYGEVTKTGEWREPLLFPSEIESDNKVNGIISLTNGSVILCLGVADSSKIKSLNCAACFIEELSQISRDAYCETMIRPRMPHPLGNKIYCATNPLHKGHWIYKHYVQERVATRKMICVSSDTNPYLPDGYTDRLGTLDDDTKKRMLKGEWTDTADGVFNRFDKARHVKKCRDFMSLDYCTEIVPSVDLGGGGAYAGFVIAGKDKDGRIYIFGEHNKKAVTHREALQWLEPYRGFGGYVVNDSANAVFKNEAENAQWKIINSVKNIEASIELINSLMSEDRLIIDPSCEILISELEQAHRNSETGRVNKTRDWDVIDACRYAVWHLADIGRDKQHVSRLFFGTL